MESATFYFSSPIGIIEIIYNDEFLLSLNFKDGQNVPVPVSGLLQNCIKQLTQYFAGERQSFDLPLYISGTSFQKNVWKALKEIPYGSTMSYLTLSKQTGDIKAIRAVANANGMNKFMILVPCHRVIGTNGSLTGYAGGLPRKRWLLDHEQKFRPSGQVKLEL